MRMGIAGSGKMGREIAEERILPRVYEGIAKVIEHHRLAGDLTILATAAPFELEWRRQSAKPWDWKLVRVSNASLEIP